MSNIKETISEINTEAFCQSLEDLAAFHKAIRDKKYVAVAQVEKYRDAVCTAIFDPESREALKRLTFDKEMFFTFIMSQDFTDVEQLKVFERRTA